MASTPNPPSYMSDNNDTKEQQNRDSSPYLQPQDAGSSTEKPSLYDRICQNLPFQITCAALQCISCVVSLILFAIRLRRLAQHAVDAVTASNGAVMGILAAAVLYTIGKMIIRAALRNGGPMYLKFVWLIMDILFIVAFIMVAELTAPGRHMTSGPCHTTTHLISIQGTIVDIYNALNCKLPLGTFIFAIFSA